MDNNDSLKPQPTGGLKLMTVFIAVLALHVLVIGGFTVYHLMSGSGTEADTATDKGHKLKPDGIEVAEATAPAADAAAPDKGAAPTTSPNTPATDTASAAPAVTSPAPAPVASTPPPAPVAVTAPTPTPVKPATSSPLVITGDDIAQAAGLAPPPEPASGKIPVTSPVMATTPSAMTPAPDAALATGPVRMPPPAPKATASAAPAELAAAPSHENAPHQPVLHEAASHEIAAHPTKKESYTVKITDSYKKIAQAHHVTVAQLKEANHIKGDTLHTGQKLIIPSGKSSVAKSEKSLESSEPSGPVASETAILSASPETHATAHHRFYTIAKGDTLKKIAKKFNVSATALKDANNLTDGTKLSVGKKLRIPSRESRSAGTTVPSPVQPSQVETQPVPVAQPAQPEPMDPATASPTPAASPELATMNF